MVDRTVRLREYLADCRRAVGWATPIATSGRLTRVSGLVMEAVAEKDVFGVLADLIVDNPEGVLTRQEWLDHLDLVSNDRSLSYDIDRLLDQGAADPAILIASLLRRAGVDFQMVAGQPELD